MRSGLNVRRGSIRCKKNQKEKMSLLKNLQELEIKLCSNGRVKQSVRKFVLGGVKKEKRLLMNSNLICQKTEIFDRILANKNI